ncbi:thioredoxin family protein [Marivita hallyeonensis]|uniref:Regulatory protein SoxS n=1 Tax=Marivita hallyeonensis TaxID=996342 RepID=A0A1M5NE83_9RHOB|nr:thioredoxin family protein [Marivita hallyeonensis]SHG87830.1 hypothetical protein SAMN05443551_0889 [Marivita hallyeonensis]
MHLLKPLIFAASVSVLAAGTDHAVAEPQLIMVDQPGCIYCERWEAEIGPAYPKTAEGQFAPLLRADLREGPPDGVSYARRVTFTPTFILIEDGTELARLDGYPGEDFFWPLLTRLLTENTDFASQKPAETVQN